jgi:lysozyme
MAMITSQEGRQFIEGFEGLVLKAADDGFGNPTVGYGHTTPQGPPVVHTGMEITKEEADEILTRDLRECEYSVNTWVMVHLTQAQFDALVSFQFNTGALHHSTLLTKLNNRDYTGAADEFLKWNHANGKVVAGLTRRRQAERQMFLSSVPRPPTPTPTTPVQPLYIRLINILKGLFYGNTSR